MLDSVANGDYTSIKFILGVDSAHNHTLSQEGVLDPSKGMIWDWNTGYIFFKHEGNYKNANGEVKPIVFHYGTENARVAITLPVPKITVDGIDGLLHVNFNLNSAYSTPDNVDFNVDNFHMSSTSGDVFWIATMRSNFGDAFEFGSIDWLRNE